MLDSKFLNSWASRLVAFTESISLDCSDSRLNGPKLTGTNARQGRLSLSLGGQNQIGGAITGSEPIPRWLQAIP
ncbi:hypothetical protein ACVWXL_001792 [Bradyrhizobium sp. GM22.5]